MDNKERIAAIDFFQDEFYGHPLTCGNDSHNHELLRGKEGEDGVVRLICPSCDYVQEWIPDYVDRIYERREAITQWQNRMMRDSGNSADQR